MICKPEDFGAAGDLGKIRSRVFYVPIGVTITDQALNHFAPNPHSIPTLFSLKLHSFCLILLITAKA